MVTQMYFQVTLEDGRELTIFRNMLHWGWYIQPGQLSGVSAMWATSSLDGLIDSGYAAMAHDQLCSPPVFGRDVGLWSGINRSGADVDFDSHHDAQSANPTLSVDQPRFAEGEAIAVVKEWLITAGCKAYYYDVTEWHHEYLGGGVWKVVAHFTDGVFSRWRVYEGTAAVDQVDSAFVGVC